MNLQFHSFEDGFLSVGTCEKHGDCLFFLSESCSQSCSALKSGLGGNQVFFFLPNEEEAFQFISHPWKTLFWPFWVMETSNEGNVDVKWMR